MCLVWRMLAWEAGVRASYVVGLEAHLAVSVGPQLETGTKYREAGGC